MSRGGPGHPVQVALSRLPHGEGLPLPAYATEGSAGLDLLAAVTDAIVLDPGARTRVPTGICIALPDGYEGQVRGRSGLALRHGIVLPNAPGTVDSDYRGEVQVLLWNAGEDPVKIRRGDRIAQLIVSPVARVAWVEADTLDTTARGDGAFGHTGVGGVRGAGETGEGSDA